MRASVLSAVGGAMAVESLELPVPRIKEVLIRVVACGVCHTDLHVIRGEVKFPTPCVLGHEISGVIEQVGPGVVGLAIGDRVACSFIMPCGTCRHCVRGNEDLCEAFFSHNRLKGVLYDGETRLARQGGEPIAMYSMAGLAEYCVVPDTDVFVLPEAIGTAEAAVLGCSVFTSLGAVKNVAKLAVGETVAVVAVGGIGLNIVQMAVAFGASQIIAIDINDEKLRLAADLGATHLINSRDVDPVEAVRELTGGRGVDVAFEALGSAVTVETAIHLVDDGGRVVLVGIAPAGVAAGLDVAHVVRRKIQILGSYGARAQTDMPTVLSLVASGAIDVKALITDRFSLEQASEAYELLSTGKIVGRAVIDIQPDVLPAARRAHIAALVAPTHSSPGIAFLEVGPLGVTKGSSLGNLARSWGVAPSDVVALGDMPNDIEMLTWAGTSQAMSGGHPDALSASDDVAPPVGDDGRAQVLEHVLRWLALAAGCSTH